MRGEEELRRHLRARGYGGATVAALPSDGAPAAVFQVELRPEPGARPRRLRGTVAELRHRIATLPRLAGGHTGRPDTR